MSTSPKPHALSLRVEGLALERGGRRLAANIGFTLAPGEALLVTGPNGAGKSTLLRTLAGLLRAGEGRASISGAGLEADAEISAHAHYLGHQDALKTALSARENLEFCAGLLGSQGLAPLDALTRLGLPHVLDFPVGYLSAGQKRRVALARLLVARRAIWILDEPTTALDAASQERLAGQMAEHRAGGGIVLAATHAPLGLDDARTLQLGRPS